MKFYRKIVILTGAGISVESGIEAFRAVDGLWENHRIEDVATLEAFTRNPVFVHHFYNLRRRQLLDGVQPNVAHRALANLSKRLPGRVVLITQNIDNLHQLAGSDPILPMHGELLKIRCKRTNSLFTCLGDSAPEDCCPCCGEAGNLRPHIVWFGEMPLFMGQIEKAIQYCDLFVAIGTSGNVYPAAGFAESARYYGAHTVELNLEPSATVSQFDEQHYGPATEVVPNYFSKLT
ncbi:MAG: NAD-dependent deacetylase [Cellvibrionaceae bacterium]|jgi:NAD-dependent deacetylase